MIARTLTGISFSFVEVHEQIGTDYAIKARMTRSVLKGESLCEGYRTPTDRQLREGSETRRETGRGRLQKCFIRTSARERRSTLYRAKLEDTLYKEGAPGSPRG